MCARPRSRCLDVASGRSIAACLLAAFASACGGQLLSPQTDGGGTVVQSSGDGAASTPATPASPAMPSTMPVSPAPTSSAPGPATTGTPASNCGLSVVDYDPAGTPDCWPCARDACAADVTSCAADCACNGAVSQSLSCVASAGGMFDLTCFQPYMSLLQSDSVFAQLVTCLLQVANQCCVSNSTGGITLRDASAD
jgi:hypothetical protein